MDVVGFCNGFARIAGPRCALASDTRPSGPMLRDAAAAALLQNGTDVHDLGVAPTPVLFYEARRLGAGVMVTASHNPLEWNGLKFSAGGRGIGAGELREVLSSAEPRVRPSGGQVRAQSGYAEAARRLVGPIGGRPDVVVDAGGGAAAGYAPGLLEGLGCGVTVINGEPGASSRGPDPTAGGLEGLVGECGGGAGFAFDLDGDRVVAVLEGEVQPPDATLGLCAAWALGRGHRRFVLSVDTSSAVESVIEEGGGSVSRAPVGEANVVGRMLREGAHAGGEGSSAGFVLPGFNLCRDGMLASAVIASMVGDGSAGGVLERMRGRFQARGKVPAGARLHGAVVAAVAGMMRGRYGAVDETDGARAEVGGGAWVLVRGSNTEDAVRVSAEAGSERGARAALSEAMGMAEEAHEGLR